MIHRHIYDVLKLGFELYAADPTLVEDLFIENYGIEATEYAAIKQYFIANPPTIVNGYARTDTKFPAIAIVLMRESESQNFLADSAGQMDDEDDADDPDFGTDIESAIWEYVYHLLIYTEQPDITSYYYELTKSIMLAGLKYLTDEGCFEYHMAGADLAPDPRYIPEHLFLRQVEFSCQREFQRLVKESRLYKAFRVTGLHIDSSGSPSDVGDVKTSVGVYTEGEDD